MPMLDIFGLDAFGVQSLTARVNKLPYVPKQIGNAGLFEEQGVVTTTVLVEEREGALALIEPTQRGGPGETTDHPKRKIRSFVIPHYQRDDAVTADEVQNLRAFGTESELETVESFIDQKFAKHARSLDATLEHQRVGAIKGLVTTKSGAMLYNLYQEFEIAEPAAINFALDTPTTNIRQLCFDVIEQIESELDGESFDSVHAFVGRDFWKSLIEHKSVKETYLNTTQAAELRGDLHTLRFEFGGIVWERYRTGIKAAASAGAPFIGINEARFVPLGVPELFISRFAPADYMETVNTVGLPRYAKQWPARNGKRVNLEIQSNPISLCTQPAALRKGVRA